MNKEPFIRIVRLKGGEDIISEIEHDEESDLFLLHNPMHIIFKRLMTGQTVMMMMPWLPVELLTDNLARIPSDEVLTFMLPKEQLVTYYNKLAIEALEKMHQRREFDDSLMEEFEDEEDMFTMDESDFDETYDSEEVESNGKPTLH